MKSNRKMKGRVCAALLTMILITNIGTFPTTASESSFTDISGHWAERAIHTAVEKGLFKGTSETMFSPDYSMTRGMFVTVLGRFAESLGFTVSGHSTFTDVPRDAYFAPYVGWAAGNGIVTGTGNYRFSPSQPVTREQMCALFIRFLVFAKYDVPYGTGMAFTDSLSISDYAKSPVQSAVALGLVKGVESSKGIAFKPGANATRAEVATVFLRLDALEGIHDMNKPDDPDDGGNGSGIVDPTPSQEDIVLEAQIAGYLYTMLDNYRNMSYLITTDKAVRDCVKIMMDCLQDAINKREQGTFISRSYVEKTYETQIADARARYKALTENQKSQMDNVAARLGSTSELRAVLDYFGYENVGV